MKKIIFSLIAALFVSFSVVSPIVYAVAAEPSGEVAEANIGDIIDDADEIISFLNDVLHVVRNVNEYFSGTHNAGIDEIKAIVDDMFLDLVSSAVSLLPGGDLINLIAAWVGIFDFSITDFFGSKVQEFCDENDFLMIDFYDDYMLPCYGSVDNFVDDIYGDKYDPIPNTPTPELPSGQALAFIGDGAGSFISGVLAPVGTFCITNEICLAFLSVSFAVLGVRMLRRSVGAFGRGR